VVVGSADVAEAEGRVGLRVGVRLAAAGGETPGLEGTRGMVGRMLPGYIRVSVRCRSSDMERSGLDRKGGRS